MTNEHKDEREYLEFDRQDDGRDHIRMTQGFFTAVCLTIMVGTFVWLTFF